MRDDDVAGIAQVFFHAVSQGAADHYSAAQRLAWAGTAPQPDRWRARLADLDVLVGQDDSGRITGFFSLRIADGLVDHMFVLPEYRGTGLARRMLQQVEVRAVGLNLNRLWTEASLLARPFLLRDGWQVLQGQDVALRGETLRNFVMEKVLH